MYEKSVLRIILGEFKREEVAEAEENHILTSFIIFILHETLSAT
jgi:hypothetical protein